MLATPAGLQITVKMPFISSYKRGVPCFFPSVLFDETIDSDSGPVYYQVYHCPYPFSSAEADIFKHPQPKHTTKTTQVDTFFRCLHKQVIFSKNLHIAFGKTNIICYINSYITR